MGITDKLEADMNEFFENIEKQTPEGKKKTLKLLIDKYAHLMSTPIMLDKHDYDMIRDQAQRFFINSAFPKYLGDKKREVSSHEANVLSVAEATISVLNSKDCFKKLPKFDYRD